MFKKTKYLAIGSTLVFAALTAIDASAYTQLKCNGKTIKRAKESVTMRFWEELSPDTEWKTWYSAISSAISKSNANPSDFRFYKSTGDSDVALGNGQNEIWPTGEDIGAPAAAYRYMNCDKRLITETDIIIRATGKDPWTNSTKSKDLVFLGGTLRSLTGTMIHELGHVAGLGHTTNTYSVMGDDRSHTQLRSNSAYHYMGEDASRGLVKIYGANGSIRDVSVSSMKRVGDDGEYSSHGMGAVLNASTDQPLSTRKDSNNLPAYRVNRGQKVKVEFSYENLGNVKLEDIDTDFYISTNNYISTSDQLIGSYIIYNLSLDTVYSSFKPTLTIPKDLTRGKVYYLGVLMDGDRKISEKYESNNYTYLPIYVN